MSRPHMGDFGPDGELPPRKRHTGCDCNCIMDGECRVEHSNRRQRRWSRKHGVCAEIRRDLAFIAKHGTEAYLDRCERRLAASERAAEQYAKEHGWI